jgi:transcription-repair coupling factor (superfamily II helicase)
VPVENIDVLSRYGSESEGVTLDRLGGEAWQRRKSKMKERIREIAGELIKTAAERALRPGAIAEPDTGYAAFVDRFPYEETDDQDRAIAEVIGDLGAGKPMDRLVCGDVGFGKTEVALRAAFIAAMAGMQVALVCPTTLLARQHFNTFKERFHGMPVEIGRLSRLVPAAEAKATREGVASGQIDIVIGTHAILAKQIQFKNLGLVIVDEEQRFGVVHKERLKGLRADVHVLTLTATPIPRTLQMAMSGLRELSVIQTPPVDRLAVRTYVMPWDPVVVREALLREHYRGGQSYFVVPRVADLPGHRGVPPQRSARSQLRRRPRPDGADRGRGAHVRLSTTASTTFCSPRRSSRAARHPERQHHDHPPRRPLRPRPALPASRAASAAPRPAPTPISPPANRMLTETATKRLQVLANLDTLGRGLPARNARSRHTRRRKPARRRAVGPYQGGRLRALPVDARGGDHGGQSRQEGPSPRPTEAFSPQITSRRSDPDPGPICAGPRPSNGPLPTA